jgi:flavin-binding protein dodecin
LSAGSKLSSLKNEKGFLMSDNVYSVTEIYGSSGTSIEEAIGTAIETAGKTLRNIEWFKVSEIRGHVADNKVAHFQVGLKLGFRYER